MKIAIIGAGAMGSVYGGLLAEAGNEVYFLDVFKEHVDLCQTRQKVRPLFAATVQINIFVGQIQKRRDFIGAQRLNPQKVTLVETHVWAPA